MEFNFSLAKNTEEPSDPSPQDAWHSPVQSPIDDLNAVLNDSGVFGFVFEESGSSPSPEKKAMPYEGWNWCKMPHVNTKTYTKPPEQYELQYVEVIHRHHKRTPYAANLFPRTFQPWTCGSTTIFSYSSDDNVDSAETYFMPYSSPANPFSALLNSDETCFFPQVTPAGLSDSRQHGVDLRAVYHDLLGFLPDLPDPQMVEFRVTNNPITSHVASALIAGLFPLIASPIPLHIQPTSIDSLEPAYTCPYAFTLLSTYGIGSTDQNWTEHLQASSFLFQNLDGISHVSPTDTSWHQSWDHYFDYLSSLLCHGQPLPCTETTSAMRNESISPQCVSQTQANAALRLGHYEYSYLYRQSPSSLNYSVARFGAFIAELAENIRSRTHPSFSLSRSGSDEGVRRREEGMSRYKHNVAHDGSIAALLSILQVEMMAWPGMGAEIIFELYKQGGPGKRRIFVTEKRLDSDKAESRMKPKGVHKDKMRKFGKGEEGEGWFVRVLYGGQTLRSSHPDLGIMDMVSVKTLLAYFDALVGENGEKVFQTCSESSDEGK